jgi:hypothetical protein
MFTKGNWKCEEINDLISINATSNDDEYLLEYKLNEENVSELIDIFFSNDKHALLKASKKFGRINIFILNDHTIKINNKVYKKMNYRP